MKTAAQLVEDALPHMVNAVQNVLLRQRNIHDKALATEVVRNALQYLVQLLDERDTQIKTEHDELYGYQLEHSTAHTFLGNYGAHGGSLDAMMRDAIRIAYENGKAAGKREVENVPAL